MDIARTTFAPPEKDGAAPPSFSETPTSGGPPPVPPKKSGCGCAVLDAPVGAGWAALLGVAFLARRYRRGEAQG
jgi:MYXO-CTERM domain-containing protein